MLRRQGMFVLATLTMPECQQGRGRESTVDGPSPCVECLLIVTPFLFSYVYLYDGSRIAPLGQQHPYTELFFCFSEYTVQFNFISFHCIQHDVRKSIVNIIKKDSAGSTMMYMLVVDMMMMMVDMMMMMVDMMMMMMVVQEYQRVAAVVAVGGTKASAPLIFESLDIPPTTRSPRTSNAVPAIAAAVAARPVFLSPWWWRYDAPLPRSRASPATSSRRAYTGPHPTRTAAARRPCSYRRFARPG